jgi:predicted cupin superfamily sugar epimerase
MKAEISEVREPKFKLEIELNMEEAKALQAVMGKVDGKSEGRNMCKEIYYLLQSKTNCTPMGIVRTDEMGIYFIYAKLKDNT